MAKPRGRPQGSGYPEDEPVLLEMVKALRSGEVRSDYAAAKKFADRVPGTSPEAKERRLYSKIRKRRAELESLIEQEDEGEGIDEAELELIIAIGQEVASKTSFDDKLAYLTRVFRPAAISEALTEELIEVLRAEGLELSDNLKGKLGFSLHYYRMLAMQMPINWELIKIRKARRARKLVKKAKEDLSSNTEEKKPNTGS